MPPGPRFERRGAMVARSLSSSKKFRRLSLLAKAALPLLWAWSDDQGRLEVDPEQLLTRELVGLHRDFQADAESQVSALFEEYAEATFGILYEYEPGRRAFQWSGWYDHNPLRTYHPSTIPAPEGWTDQQKDIRNEPWYQERTKAQQVAKEIGLAGSKVGKGGPTPPPALQVPPGDQIEILRARYSHEQRTWLDEAVSAIRQQQGPASDQEILAEYQAWDRCSTEAVAGACQTFVGKLLAQEGRGFDYLRGIVKRWEPGEQPVRRRKVPGGEEKRTGLVTLLLNQSYNVPRPTDQPGIKQFREKLVDVMVGDGVKRLEALHLVRALRVEEWYEQGQEEIEKRIRSAVKQIGKPQKEVSHV